MYEALCSTPGPRQTFTHYKHNAHSTATCLKTLSLISHVLLTPCASSRAYFRLWAFLVALDFSVLLPIPSSSSHSCQTNMKTIEVLMEYGRRKKNEKTETSALSPAGREQRPATLSPPKTVWLSSPLHAHRLAFPQRLASRASAVLRHQLQTRHVATTLLFNLHWHSTKNYMPHQRSRSLDNEMLKQWCILPSMNHRSLFQDFKVTIGMI